MIHLQLTDAQQRELEGVSRHAIGRVALRAHRVLLAGRGYSVPQIAAIHACGTDVVRTWLHRYVPQGSAGLEDHSRSGRPPQDRQAGPIVDAQASQSPRCSGHVQACWSVALLAAFLARRFRLVLSRSVYPPLSASDGLALGAAPPGAGPHARSRDRGERRRAGSGRSRGRWRDWRTCSPWTRASCTCCRWCAPGG